MFPGTKLLNLVIFLLTIGWAVMGQDIFGREHIQIMSSEISHRISEKIHLDKAEEKIIVAKNSDVFRTSFLVDSTANPVLVKKKMP